MRQLLILSLAFNALVLLGSCGSAMSKMPHWDGEFWAGDHNERAVVIRKPNQAVRKIPADSPEFSNGAWLTYRSIGCLAQQLVLNCKEWKSPTPECKEVDQQTIKNLLQQIP